MELKYYLWKNNIKQKDFAKIVGVCPATLIQILKRNISIKAATAVKIVIATHGKISLSSLLNDEELKDIKNLESDYKIFIKNFSFNEKKRLKIEKKTGRIFVAGL